MIYKAVVMDNRDPFASGRVRVNCQALQDIPFWVDYASPIAGPGHGFVSIPRVGTGVLIAQVDGTNEYYWFACTYDRTISEAPSDQRSDELIESYGIPEDRLVYRGNTIPQKTILKSPSGHKIDLSEKLTTGQEAVNEDYISIITAGSKQLLLDDAKIPGGDKILLMDENQNRIKIQSGGDNPDSIDVICDKNINITSVNGSIDIGLSRNSDGDIELSNFGKGDIFVKTFEGDIVVSSKDNVSINTDGFNVDSKNLLVKGGGGTIKMDNFSVEIDSDNDMVIECGGILTLKAKEIKFEQI